VTERKQSDGKKSQSDGRKGPSDGKKFESDGFTICLTPPFNV